MEFLAGVVPGCHDAPVTVNHGGGWPMELGLLDAFDAAAFAVDAGGRVVYANQTAERLFGRPGGALTGETLMTHLFNENEQQALAVVVRQVLDGRPWRGRLDVRHTDGSVHQAELTCSPLWRDQAVAGHLCVVDDTGTARGAVREARRLGDRLTRLARVTTALVMADTLDAVTKIVVSLGADAAGATVASLAVQEGEDRLRLVG